MLPGERSLMVAAGTPSRWPVRQPHTAARRSSAASTGTGCRKGHDMEGVTPRRPIQIEMPPIVEEFFREGCVLVPGVLDAETVAALRAKTDFYAADPNTPARHKSYSGSTLVLRFCHELDPLFAEVAGRDSIVSLAAAALDNGAAFNAMNVIRNEPGQAISHWHIDDVLEFPLPEAIARFDAQMRMPVTWLTLQVPLSDIDSLEQ